MKHYSESDSGVKPLISKLIELCTLEEETHWVLYFLIGLSIDMASIS